MNKEKGCITINCGCCGGDNITGVAPTIGENGNWFIGDEDTGVKAQGEDGKSAYGVAVEAGFTGTVEEWLVSLKGAAGEAGAKGEKGDPGVPGAQGPAGPIGNFAAMDVLFEGNANVEGSTYNLRGNVNSYTCLIVEITMSYNLIVREYQIVPFPQITELPFVYGDFIFAPDVGSGVTGSYHIRWHFSTNNVLTVDVLTKLNKPGVAGRNDLAITKIYGIK